MFGNDCKNEEVECLNLKLSYLEFKLRELTKRSRHGHWCIWKHTHKKTSIVGRQNAMNRQICIWKYLFISIELFAKKNCSNRFLLENIAFSKCKLKILMNFILFCLCRRRGMFSEYYTWINAFSSRRHLSHRSNQGLPRRLCVKQKQSKNSP